MLFSALILHSNGMFGYTIIVPHCACAKNGVTDIEVPLSLLFKIYTKSININQIRENNYMPLFRSICNSQKYYSFLHRLSIYLKLFIPPQKYYHRRYY